MADNKLAGVLRSVALRLRADFAQSVVMNHRGEAGGTRELLFQRYLADQLPGHVRAVHNVEIVSADGQVSRQADVVIADRNVPPLTTLAGLSVLVNECVYGVTEMKSSLDGAELRDACEKIRAAKRLPKTAFHPRQPPAERTAYGRTYPYVPTVGIIFAFSGLELDTLGSHLLQWCDGRDAAEWPDSVWILGKGYLMWTDPATGLINPTPEPGSSLIAFRPHQDEDILLALTLHLQQQFVTAWMPPLRLFDYAQHHPLGEPAFTWTHIEDDPVRG
ncbi:hypothetical protein LO762_21555 [Actinocorallia sp. API 0066]|uniref:DUF6602 domain-containing protein n=1 Tax=Actinocorallia sp. API 0066 TaxID=2896846 RepID=UPI001E34FC18|nr:DUF6602 domain-containing protein [Actinocorallia sp. API 0066]MCD0451760.1 hypothetical protein [Actinocorallia sp. API 0066]